MAGNRADAGDVRSEVARGSAAAGTPGEALCDVGDDHRSPGGAPQEAEGVHAPWIPAPTRAQVDAAACCQTRRDVGRRYRADEVAERERGEETEESHDGATPMMRMRSLLGLAGFGIGLWALLVRGALTVDLGIGRRYRPLGPLRVTIAAPRDVVFDVVSSPYLGRTPRAFQAKLDVVERGADVVLAAHHTPAYGLTATTLETVRFEPPERVYFRLVRGPVPYVVEQFVLHATGSGTELEYRGELGTDLWDLGRLWGAAVARTWEATVESSLQSVKDEAERRAKGA